MSLADRGFRLNTVLLFDATIQFSERFIWQIPQKIKVLYKSFECLFCKQGDVVSNL